MTKQELFDLIKTAEENHINLYHDINKEVFNEYLNKTADIIESLPFLKAKFEIAKLFTLFKDGHTHIVWGTHYLPINFKIIDNKVYISNIVENLYDYKYCQVEEINGININKILEQINEIVCSDTEAYKVARIKSYLGNIEILNALNVIKEDAKNVDITINNQGKLTTISLPVDDKDYFVQSKLNYSVSRKDNICIIKYSKSLEDSLYPYAQFEKDIKDNLLLGEKIIVDLRNNTGGSFLFFKTIIDYIKENKNTGYVLINNSTFSAGALACFTLYQNGFIRVGQPMGNSVRRYGESKFFTQSGIKFSVSTQLYDFSSKLKQGTTNAPDIFIPETLEDWKAHKDKVMEYCTSKIKK